MIRSNRWNEATKTYEEVVLGVGTTVERGETYAGDDMYSLWAVYFDAEKEAFVQIGYSGGYPEQLDYRRCEVDAPPELAEAYKRYSTAAECRREWSRQILSDSRAACQLTRGKHVVVIRGRKVPIGTCGTLIWVGEGDWGPRVGIKDAAGNVHWTAASNVQVTDEAYRSQMRAMGYCDGEIGTLEEPTLPLDSKR